MITGRNTPKSKSLVRYLSLNYLFFTGTILLMLLAIYGIYVLYARRTAPIPDLEGLLKTAQETEDSKLGRLDHKRYLGAGSVLTVTGSAGNLLYSSDPQTEAGYTPGELACIPRYDWDSLFLTASLPEESENGAYLITQARYDEQGEIQIDGYLFLDSDLNVLSGSIPTGRAAFTPAEFQYLSGKDFLGRRLIRMEYQNPSGQKLQLTAAFYEAGYEAYERVYRFWDRIWLLFIPAYLLAAAGFIFLMTRKARIFLNPLNLATLRVARGKDSQLETYRGPEEFSGLARNFVRMEQQLKESREAQKRTEEQRRQLLADISHDLKTPAAVIQGCACALKDGLVPVEEQSRYLETMIQRSEQVGRLLSQFHEYNKLELSSLPVRPQRLDLCGLVREYFANRYQELEQKGFPLEADIPEAPLYSMVDPQLLCRILDNLVQNSVAHNPQGVPLFVSLSRDDSFLVLLFGDQGKGIPESIRQRLFDPFVTGDAARSESRGSGLGLAIAKKLTILQGGSISLVSSDTLSACFQVRLPAAPQEGT